MDEQSDVARHVAVKADEPDLLKLKDSLEKKIQGFLDHSWSLRRRHFWLNALVVVLGLLLSAGVTLTGALDMTEIAPFMGAAITVLLGIQNAFKFAEKATLWEAKHGEAKDLRDRLNYKARTADDFQSLVDSWLVLRKELTAEMPKVGKLEEANKSQVASGAV
jgi:hypothetical protein